MGLQVEADDATWDFDKFEEFIASSLDGGIELYVATPDGSSFDP
jgi:hypothetical protein